MQQSRRDLFDWIMKLFMRVLRRFLKLIRNGLRPSYSLLRSQGLALFLHSMTADQKCFVLLVLETQGPSSDGEVPAENGQPPPFQKTRQEGQSLKFNDCAKSTQVKTMLSTMAEYLAV